MNRVWTYIFDLIDFGPMEEPIDERNPQVKLMKSDFKIDFTNENPNSQVMEEYHPLKDLNSQIARNILFIFSMDTFLYSLINKTIKEEDNSKIQSLGPYTYALSLVL